MNILHVLTFVFTVFIAGNAAPVINHPVNYSKRQAASKVSFGYFTNWGIYENTSNFKPMDIVTDTLTHIIYAFADTDPVTGAIKLSDEWADEQIRFPGDSQEASGQNLYGCLKQLYLSKKQNRNLNVLLSIGGWTYSQTGHFGFISAALSREKFVSDAVKVIEDYGFDGIDLDFEYPANDTQGQDFANLITGLRKSFDRLQTTKQDTAPYQITAAVSAGPDNYKFLKVKQMDADLSYWNLMAFDYAGLWLNISDNQANLYPSARTNVSTDEAVKWFKSQGASPNKINMGIPLYGRVFKNTTGIGKTYNRTSTGADSIPYKSLPLTGAQIITDTNSPQDPVASYFYDNATQELISYDTPDIVKIKAQYINNQSLAGAMFWELSNDKVNQSLVSTVVDVFGSLDKTTNHLNYPGSKWDNIRNSMSGAGASSSTVTSSLSATLSVTSTTSTASATSAVTTATLSVTSTTSTTSATSTTSSDVTTSLTSASSMTTSAPSTTTITYTSSTTSITSLSATFTTTSTDTTSIPTSGSRLRGGIKARRI